MSVRMGGIDMTMSFKATVKYSYSLNPDDRFVSHVYLTLGEGLGSQG